MKTLLLFTVVPVFCFAQSIGQLGMSAAGGSAAGAAGKKVSDGFDAVMKKGSNILDGAAKTGKPKRQKQRVAPLVPPEPSFPGATAAADPSSIASAPAHAPRTSAPVYRPRRETGGQIDLAASMASLMIPQPARPAPAEQLRSIEVGSSRDALIGQVGKPAGRITMYDERGLVEVYSFREGRSHVGSVRLVNGTVTEVKLP
ncbi:MAG: hypothetical protein SFV51_26745 [Bryobacteraceae bacterium]|nr:hypothetical protein [Bryobacteraceae bacterium]